jgi:hypothetical protein
MKKSLTQYGVCALAKRTPGFAGRGITESATGCLRSGTQNFRMGSAELRAAMPLRPHRGIPLQARWERQLTGELKF